MQPVRVAMGGPTGATAGGTSPAIVGSDRNPEDLPLAWMLYLRDQYREPRTTAPSKPRSGCPDCDKWVG